MKILWIYPEFPYPLTSGYLRGFHLLRMLGHDHSISFLTLSNEAAITADRIHVLQAYTQRIEVFSRNRATLPKWVLSLGHVPMLGNRVLDLYSCTKAVDRMRRAVRKLLQDESFDVILFHGREAISVLDGLSDPIVVDCGDTNFTRIKQQMQHSEPLRRPLLWLRSLRERRIEQALARRTTYRCFISERDRENLLGASDKSEIVPQGIDHQYWTRRSPHTDDDCVVFSGVMNYAPNVDAATFLLDEIVPLVRKRKPSLEVLIVGRDPSRSILRAARGCGRATVTGTVDDIRPFLERASIFVAALRFASGVQNKVLEAMSMEVPVITTPVVATGLRVEEHNPPIVIAHNAEGFAAEIVRLLECSEERRRLARDGREFIKANCSWARSAEKLEKLCMTAVSECLTCRIKRSTFEPVPIRPSDSQ